MHDFNGMTHNIKKDLRDPRLRRAAAKEALSHCRGGIGGLNEINADDVPYIKSILIMYKLTWYRRGELAIVWDPRVIKIRRASWRLISHGGYVGADETPAGPDNRRVGPSRYALKARGHVVSDGTPLQVVLVHKIAKAFTEHRWREKIWRRSTRRTSRFINRSLKNYPNGFIIGDENAPFLVDYPNLLDVAVNTPPTMGRKRYDQVHTFGAFFAINVSEFDTPSDHNGLRFRIRKIKT